MNPLVTALQSAVRLLGMTSAAIILNDSDVFADDKHPRMHDLVASFRRASAMTSFHVFDVSTYSQQATPFWKDHLHTGCLFVSCLDSDNDIYCMFYADTPRTIPDETFLADVNFIVESLKRPLLLEPRLFRYAPRIDGELQQDATKTSLLVSSQRKTLQALRELHHVTSDISASLEQKLHRILEIGADQYELPLGIISTIEYQTYTVRYCISPQGQLSSGMVFDLGETYCVHTLKNRGPTFFHHTAESAIKHHPCYKAFGLESYIGDVIRVNGEVWGTLNFSHSGAKAQPFSDDDIELIKLLSHWVGNEISRYLTFEKLQASEAQQSLLLNSAHDGFLGIDLDGLITFANPSACRITGYSLEALLGQHHCVLTQSNNEVGPFYAIEDCPVSQTLLTGERCQSSAQRLWGKNTSFIGEYNCMAMKSVEGVIEGAVITFRDRSQQIESEQKIQEQKKLFESLFVDAPAAIALVSKQRVISMVNPAFCNLFGYSEAEILGQNTSILYANEDDYERIGIEYYSGDVDRRVPLNRVAYTSKSGCALYCETASSVIKDKQGNVEGYIGHITDISDRLQGEKEILRANRRFSMASNAAGIGVWELDLSTQTLVWDDWMYHLYGVSKEDIKADLQELWLQMVHPDDAPVLSQKLTRFIEKGGQFDTHFRIIRQDGQHRYLKSNCVMEHDLNGYPARLIGVNLDITSQMETEAVLRKASKESELANKAKSDFLATMSHEIRTPLNGVLGMAELLSNSTLNNEQATQLDILRGSGESLLELINEILDFSKIEAGQLDIEAVDFNLEKTIYDVIRLLMVSAEKKGLDLLVEYSSHTPSSFIGDAFRIKQILINLVNNAIKFTHKGQVVVSIHSELSELGGVNLILDVRDTGIGISKQAQKTLFNAFTQKDTSTTRKFGGTGLGLAITKQLVELMGGSIELASEEGVGSVFSVSLSLMESYQYTPHELVDLSLCGNAKVLLIDDNATNLMILSNQLLELGLQCDQELDAQQGYQRVVNAIEQSAPYDLIILDYQMPDLDGLSLSTLIREKSLNRYSPGIIIASSSGRINQGDLNNAGINVCLTKPVDSHSLSLGIDAALNDKVLAKQVSYFEYAGREFLGSGKGYPQFRGKVLIVEDMAANIAVARGLISKMGVDIVEAENGEMAVKCWQEHKPDLILMDLHMPVMDGLTAIRTIRYTEKYAVSSNRVPIFALTADALAERISDVKLAGGDGLIVKPFKKIDIIQAFDQYLEPVSDGEWITTTELRLQNTRDKVTFNVQAVNDLKNILGDDIDLLFNAFFSDAQDIIGALQAECKKENAEADLSVVARAAHSMKSISQNLGGEELAMLSAELEVLADDVACPNLSHHISVLLDEFKLFSEALNKERQVL